MLGFFQRVPAWSVEEVRRIMKEHDAEEYSLLDVREDREFAEGHIPGARNAPLGRLEALAAAADPDKPVIAYDRSGVRSRAAVGILKRAGFKDVRSMAGGMEAWDGLQTTPFPTANVTVLSGAETLAELIALAWILEDGARRYYEQVAEVIDDKYAAWAFREVSGDESQHQRALEQLHRDLLASAVPHGFPYSVVPDWDADLIEGGLRLTDVLEWSEGKTVANVAEMAVALEANAYDLHLAMKRRFTDRASVQVFLALSRQEKVHLEKMTKLMLDRA